ncbi:hypothetical protein [Rubritalea sp.]|uniref:hypothetical protein n=1 Tax=Rubritalea sp. TaxID=2109375 RepID=UPI003EF70853
MKYLLISLTLCLVYSSCRERLDETTVERTLESELESPRVVIKGIDFENAESIAAVLKGVNMVRAKQNVTLYLDGTRELDIIEESNLLECGMGFWVYNDGILSEGDTAKMSRDEFMLRIKGLVEALKYSGTSKIPLFINFDKDVSGSDGFQLLKDLCDHGIALTLSREKTKAERALQLEREIKNRSKSPPSAPSSAAVGGLIFGESH